jgi:hypothetical protein
LYFIQNNILRKFIPSFDWLIKAIAWASEQNVCVLLFNAVGRRVGVGLEPHPPNNFHLYKRNTQKNLKIAKAINIYSDLFLPPPKKN